MSVLARLRSGAWPVIAVLALAAAGVGTAAATGHRSPRHAPAPAVVSAAALPKRGPRGPRGFKGSRGPQGKRGLQGLQGLQGRAGTNATGGGGGALAFAHVPAAGGAVATKSITPANVQHTAGTGLYCFSGLSANPSNVSVTLGADGNAVNATAEIGILPGCGAGTQVSVKTFSITVDTNSGNVAAFNGTDNGFYIALN